MHLSVKKDKIITTITSHLDYQEEHTTLNMYYAKHYV